jgi:Glycosyl hydrolase catalytic core/Ricin-type beta-trefoil lectin domain-like
MRFTERASRSLRGNPWKPGVAIRALILIAGVLVTERGSAANVTLLSTDASGFSSFTGATNWSNDAAPSAGNNYFTSTFGMRTPGDANNYTFAGGSLTLSPGTTTGYSLIYKGSAAANTYTINNLTNNGGLIRSGAGSGNTCIIAGNMVVAGNSTIEADQSPFVISANLSGGAVLTNLNPGPQTYGTVTYSGNNSAFTGELYLGPNAIVILNNVSAAPGNPASQNLGQITLGAGSTVQDNAGVTLANANGGLTLTGAAAINVNGANLAMTINEPFLGGANPLTKAGTGTLYFDSSTGYTGTTTVSTGTVAGAGSIRGPVVVSSGGNFGAGDAATTGNINLLNSLALQGNATLRINFTGGMATNDEVFVSGNASYGGVLTVTNITSDGTQLTTNNTFQLFHVTGASSGGFTTINGSPGPGLSYSFNTTNGMLSVVTTSSLQAGLAHRYSFFAEPNGSTTLTDTVASANGALAGTAAIHNGQLVLTGNSGSYANLPAGLITGDTAVTIESWADYGTLPANCYLFSLGNTDPGGNGEDYIFCAPQAARITISGVDPGYNGEQNASTTGWSGLTNLHVTAVFNPPGGYLAIYTNGFPAASNNGITTGLSAVNDAFSYLGKSLYNADPYAPIKVDEFRIWNGVLAQQQIALDAASGPTQIITNPGPAQAVHLSLPNQIPVKGSPYVYNFVPGGTVASTANLLAAGTAQAVVTGDFSNVTGVNLLAYGQPTFASSNTSIMTVNAAGVVTALTTGTTTITASYGGLSASQSVSGVVSSNRFIFDSFSDGFWNILGAANVQALVAGASGTTQAPVTNGATTEQYELLYNIQNNTFRIRQEATWECLGLQGGATNAGTGIVLQNYTGAATQQWILQDAGSGSFRIVNAAANLMLETDNGSPATISLQASNNTPFERWTFAYQTNFPKKGSAGYEGQPYQSELQTGWAYNYDDNTGATESAGFNFVPMLYDAQDWENLGAGQSLDAGWLNSPKPNYILAYNEPDNASQSDTTTTNAIANWPGIQALDVPLVGPGTQDTLDAWENGFYSMLNSNNYRVDYASVHEYVPPNAASLISDCQSVYNAYGRPVWLTEFSPVDWNNCRCWSEDDDYNFLGEFMWQAQNQPWLRRFSIFPFSTSNTNSPWVDNGFRGSVFLADGQTLSPYGELYATWDADTNLHPQIPYIIHNLGTSFRLTCSNGLVNPQASTIYVRNATTEWALLNSPDGRWYIISLSDGRRLSDTGGGLRLLAPGTTGTSVEWTFTGPNSSGYYYIGNPAGGHNLNGSGTAPAISFSLVSSSTQTSATQWRLVKPYQAVGINTNATPPVIQSAVAGDGSVTLTWSGGGGAPYFNVYRGTNTGGPYAAVASAWPTASYQDGGLTDGMTYFYVVTAMNILGQESAYSGEVAVTPTSFAPVNLGASVSSDGNNLQLSWPDDHTGWILQMDTNPLTGGSNDWQTVAGSSMTNAMTIPFSTTNASVYFRLVEP